MNYEDQLMKKSGFIFKTNELSNYAQRQRDSRNLDIYYKLNESLWKSST